MAEHMATTTDLTVLVRVLDETVEGLAGQQAMPDESWRNSYREVRSKLLAALQREAPTALVTLRDVWERHYVAHHANPTPDSARELNAIEGRLLAWTPDAAAPPVAARPAVEPSR